MLPHIPALPLRKKAKFYLAKARQKLSGRPCKVPYVEDAPEDHGYDDNVTTVFGTQASSSAPSPASTISVKPIKHVNVPIAQVQNARNGKGKGKSKKQDKTLPLPEEFPSEETITM